MTTRRLFIKQIFISAWMLFSCGTQSAGCSPDRKAVTRPREETAQHAPEAITLAPAKGSVIQVDCRLTKAHVASLDMHPLQGALLCGVEAHNQVPRCVPLFKDNAMNKVRKECHNGFCHYRFMIDVDQALGLDGSGNVYFIHLACRQLRSAVMAYSPKKSATK
jgi:hypothetical protein